MGNGVTSRTPSRSGFDLSSHENEVGTTGIEHAVSGLQTRRSGRSALGFVLSAGSRLLLQAFQELDLAGVVNIMGGDPQDGRQVRYFSTR